MGDDGRKSDGKINKDLSQRPRNIKAEPPQAVPGSPDISIPQLWRINKPRQQDSAAYGRTNERFETPWQGLSTCQGSSYLRLDSVGTWNYDPSAKTAWATQGH